MLLSFKKSASRLKLKLSINNLGFVIAADASLP
jgi:hypothetical protein